MKKLNQSGFHVLPIVLVVVVLAVVGLVGWRVLAKKSSKPQPSQQSTKHDKEEFSAGKVTWEFTGERWRAYGNPPACPEPLVFKRAPVDVSKATHVVYPGQTRGNNYKPHGGFRFEGLQNTDITVVAPMNAVLVEGSRYIEQGEVQYMLRFTNDCGISYRFDHLLTLSPTIQAQVGKLPQPRQDDSRTTKFEQPIAVKTGDVIATAVGFENAKNVAVDFGVYDLRQLNKAAQKPDYMSQHQNEISQAGFAVCWFDMLPSGDATRVKSLPAGDQTSGKTSDYCN